MLPHPAGRLSPAGVLRLILQIVLWSYCRQLQICQRFNVTLNLFPLFVTRQPQIVVGLQARPHFRAGAKEPHQPQRRDLIDLLTNQDTLINVCPTH